MSDTELGVRLTVRASALQVAAWEAAADREPVSSWVRRVLDEAALGEAGVAALEAPVSPSAEDGSLEALALVEGLGADESSGGLVRDASRRVTPARCSRRSFHRKGVFCKECGFTP